MWVRVLAWEKDLARVWMPYSDALFDAPSKEHVKATKEHLPDTSDCTLGLTPVPPLAALPHDANLPFQLESFHF